VALIESFVNRTLPDVFGCPLPIVEQAVFDSLRDWADKTWTIRSGFSVSVDALGDNNDAATADLSAVVPTNHRIIALDNFMLNGGAMPLVLRELVAMQDENYLATAGFRYFDIPSATSFRVYPSVVGDIFDGQAICIPLEAADEVPDILYDEWVEPIVAGAKARLLSMPQKGWSNPEYATELRRAVRRGMLAANRKYNKSRTRGALRVQPRSFTNG
jgi:hypothetical protein